MLSWGGSAGKGIFPPLRLLGSVQNERSKVTMHRRVKFHNSPPAPIEIDEGVKTRRKTTPPANNAAAPGHRPGITNCLSLSPSPFGRRRGVDDVNTVGGFVIPKPFPKCHRLRRHVTYWPWWTPILSQVEPLKWRSKLQNPDVFDL